MTTATELATWRNGTPTGGPEGDGRYPLTYADGLTYLVFCPAAQALNPLVTEQPVQVFAEAAQAAATTATTKADQAETSRIAAAASASNAATSASTALTNKNAAATSATTASTAATAAAASNTAAADWADVANDAATAAELSATAAAAAAAEFDNGLYYTKVEADGRYRLLSTSITWTELADKPSTFAPSAHAHTIADVTGLQSALDGKQAAGSYAAATHNHAIDDVTGLQGALDAKLASASFTWSNLPGKPSTFAPSAHNHVIGDVTGLQTALDGKQANIGFTPANKAGDTFTGQTQVGSTFRVTGATDFSSGVGLELYFSGDRSYIVSLQRGTIAWKDIYVYGNAIQLYSSGDLALAITSASEFSRKVANSTATMRIPRVFVQSGDPGAAAADGDLWIW